MEKSKCQVEKDELKNPVCIKTIQEKILGSEARAKQAEEQAIGYLERLRIRFAVERGDSVTEIFVEADSLEE